MNPFTDAVRQGSHPQPTQRGFKRESWAAFLQQFGDAASDDDRSLQDSGLLIDDILQTIRTELASTRRNEICRLDQVQTICAIINRDTAILANEQTLWKQKTQDVISASDVINNKMRLPSGVQATPDQIFTMMLDSIIYPLDQALQCSDAGRKIEQRDIDEFPKVLWTAQAYHLASEAWLDCLWNNKFFETINDDTKLIREKDSIASQRRAISNHRADLIHFSLVQGIVRLWKNELTLFAKRLLLPPKKVAGISEKNRHRFIVKSQTDFRKHNIPYDALSLLIATEEHLKAFTELPFPNFPDLSLGKILRCWYVLRSLAQQLISTRNSTAGDLASILQFAPIIKRNELVNILKEALTFDESICQAAISFLTYEIRTDGLWQKPLVTFDQETFFVATGPLLFSNMRRVSERWLQQGGQKLDERGHVFEEYVRSEVKYFLTNSKLLQDTAILEKPIKVGEEKEEVDLIIRVGKLILVGEVKCQSEPYSALERYRTRQILEHAASQAARKVIAVKENPNVLDPILGTRQKADLVFVPIVISSSQRVTGFPVKGVAVADLTFLRLLLQTGGVEQMVSFSAKGEKEGGFFNHFYRSEAEAELKIPFILMNQPVVQILTSSTKRRIRPHPLTRDNRKFAEEYYEVASQGNPIDFVP